MVHYHFFHKTNEDGYETYWAINSEPFCEHCYDLDPYSITYFDGGTTWCLACASTGEHLNELSDDELLQLLTKENELQIAYYQNAIEELQLDKPCLTEKVAAWRRY